MNTSSAVQNFSLTMNRTFNASMQTVYEAWIQQEALITWFKASSDMKTIIHKLNPEAGGEYSFEMVEPDGTPHVMYGEYISLSPYKQLVFTWK